MTKVKNDLPKSVPTTGRTPAFLAKRHGFASLSDFIRDIPKDATVLDIGAGLSLLGHAVAARRSDITWINIDPFYKNDRYLAAASDAPNNVRYMAEDITNPSKELSKIKAKRIFSYWMLPHLSVHSVAPAKAAVGVMWDLLDESGIMSVGPVNPHQLISMLDNVRTLRFSKNDSRDYVVGRVATVTRMPACSRAWQRLQNSYLRPVLNVLLRALTTSQMRRARKTIQ